MRNKLILVLVLMTSIPCAAYYAGKYYQREDWEDWTPSIKGSLMWKYPPISCGHIFTDPEADNCEKQICNLQGLHIFIRVCHPK